MNKTKLGALLGALTLVLGLSGCVADGTYYSGGGYGGGGYGGGYGGGGYGGGYGPGYYGASGPVVVAGGPVYGETVVVDNNRYRGRGGYGDGGRRTGPYTNAYRRGGSDYSRRGRAAVVNRRGASRRTPAPVYHRGDRKRPDSR